LVAAVISYAFFGLDAIADELQAFADTPMIVPLDATARALELGILEMLGQKQLPPPMQPKNFVLT
jgi:putative membrane protein